MAPTLSVKGNRGGTAANDPRWKDEHVLGEAQALLVEINEARRVIEQFALYPDPLDWTGAMDHIYAEAQVIGRATDKLLKMASRNWLELVEAIRGDGNYLDNPDPDTP